MAKSVSRDLHKMKAFVRFKENTEHESERRKFAAWFEPEHFIVEPAGDFFVQRFHDMDWIIATPKGTAFYTENTLKFDHKPAQKLQMTDDTEELWKIYYASIFNPARLKVKAMRSEMPKKYWHNLPEAMLIPDLIKTAAKRATKMRISSPSKAAGFADAARAPEIHIVKPRESQFSNLIDLNNAARTCQRCTLHCNATQTVVGEGDSEAKLMIVGEQPGDAEDLAGRPFVGPAGKLLDEALKNSNIKREKAYVTNAVKHFKFEPRGKRRIHQRPNRYEVQHCKYWLINEIEIVRPTLIIAMGATAAGALTGSDSNIATRRGRIVKTDFGPSLLITFHPAAILRAGAYERADEMKSQLLADLNMAAAWLAKDTPVL